MLGFFNTENRWRAAMQATNTLMLLITASKIISDPETAWENGFEIALLALNIVTFSKNDNALMSIGNAALNFTGLGTAYAGATSVCASTSLLENAGNALLHLTNAVTSICYNHEETNSAQQSRANSM
ncbi:Uncharacterised protein [Legionella wadsworthii]|uniref:Uncharacterized protein n=1 Tax=Legionella wadsworthii TaxID=28088 RepID=A0A378M156_9GAMM|nr:hypothetical protein [Legionella wadsworthii]STY30178.1 Uncharacterised protein [Legionella wadsworthii]